MAKWISSSFCNCSWPLCAFTAQWAEFLQKWMLMMGFARTDILIVRVDRVGGERFDPWVNLAPFVLVSGWRWMNLGSLSGRVCLEREIPEEGNVRVRERRERVFCEDSRLTALRRAYYLVEQKGWCLRREEWLAMGERDWGGERAEEESFDFDWKKGSSYVALSDRHHLYEGCPPRWLGLEWGERGWEDDLRETRAGKGWGKYGFSSFVQSFPSFTPLFSVPSPSLSTLQTPILLYDTLSFQMERYISSPRGVWRPSVNSRMANMDQSPHPNTRAFATSTANKDDHSSLQLGPQADITNFSDSHRLPKAWSSL